MTTIYKEIGRNKSRTVLLLISFMVFVIALGWLFSWIYNNYSILIIAIIISIIQAAVSYFSGDKIALSISGAIPIKKADNPTLWNTIENLSITAGLPMPAVYIIPDDAPNAFATGRDPEHASIAVTTGLLKNLEKSELQGVIAHELSHIGNYDIRLMMIVVVLVGVIALISDFFIRARFLGFGGRSRDNQEGQLGAILIIVAIVAAILAPVAATLIQLAISRKREYLADSSGALLTRYPEGLASALEKISSYAKQVQKVSGATAHLYISDPMGKKESYFQKIFSTHPPITERIRLLRGMSV